MLRSPAELHGGGQAAPPNHFPARGGCLGKGKCPLLGFYAVMHPRAAGAKGVRLLQRNPAASCAHPAAPRLTAAPAAPLRRRGHAPHLLLHHPRRAAVGVARGRAAQPALPGGARPRASAVRRRNKPRCFALSVSFIEETSAPASSSSPWQGGCGGGGSHRAVFI